MTKKTSLTWDDALIAGLHQCTQRALAEGCNPAELSRALTVVAVRIGLDLAPSAGVAFAIAMRAASDAAAEWASSQHPQDATPSHSVEQPFIEGAVIQRQAIKVHQVFADLRRALGTEIPAVEVLQLAAKLVAISRPSGWHSYARASRRRRNRCGNNMICARSAIRRRATAAPGADRRLPGNAHLLEIRNFACVNRRNFVRFMFGRVLAAVHQAIDESGTCPQAFGRTGLGRASTFATAVTGVGA
jgi:hypothetical protein